MITRLEIKGFRGILEGALDGLGPLTVLTGPNSSGKSAILDALLIACSADPGDAVGRAVVRHPTFFGDASKWLVHRDASVATLDITSDDKPRSCWLQWSGSIGPDREFGILFGDGTPIHGAHSQATTIFETDRRYHVFQQYRRPGSAHLIDPGIPIPLHETYSRVVRAGRKSAVVELLKTVSGDITDMELLTDGGSIGLYLIERGQGVPVELTGDGVQGFVQLALELGSIREGLALIEEPEVYQHPRAIWQSARTIVAAVRRGVQVVLTTHSLELVDALLAAREEVELEDGMVLFNLALDRGELKVARHEGAELKVARESMDQDLR